MIDACGREMLKEKEENPFASDDVRCDMRRSEGYKTPFQLGKRAVVAVKVGGLESIDQAFVPNHHSLVGYSYIYH